MSENIIEFKNLIKNKKYDLALEYISKNKIENLYFDILIKEFNQDYIQYEKFIYLGLKNKILNERKAFTFFFMLVNKCLKKSENDLAKSYIIKGLKIYLQSHLKNFDLNISFSNSYPYSLLSIKKKNYLLEIILSTELEKKQKIHTAYALTYIISPVLISAQINRNYSKIFYEITDYACLENTASFCSNKKSSVLIPDPRFILNKGYKDILTRIKKINFINNNAFWMGALNSNQRFLLMKYSKNKNNLICKTYKIRKKYYCKEFIESKKINFQNFFEYLVQVDVDGISNAWDSCFKKLASGFPTIKIRSEKDFAQWWYKDISRLNNIYWVEKDLSNFDEIYQKILSEWQNDFERKREENYLFNMVLEEEIKFASERVLKNLKKTPFD